ncbi:DUF4158 domain-containing protein [Nonomuraea jabiensis]|uniref:DUF4158 domain-containing protein n=1 Tax=Nonomuraea jabiensis TaxID=882448 RepID=UPI003D756A91
MFTDEEIAGLRSFPEISREELIRFFTLTAADVEFIDPGRGRGPADRLGLAVQLCALPWRGFVPADVASAPPAAVARLSERLRISVGELARYGGREQTRSTHLQQVARYLGWRRAGELERKELEEFLLARAMEHGSGGRGTTGQPLAVRDVRACQDGCARPTSVGPNVAGEPGAITRP